MTPSPPCLLKAHISAEVPQLHPDREVATLTLSSEQRRFQKLRHILGFQQEVRKVTLGQDEAQQWQELISTCTLPLGTQEEAFQMPLGSESNP